MKKLLIAILILMLVICFAFAFTACGKNDSNESKDTCETHADSNGDCKCDGCGAIAHTLTKTSATAATCTTDGNKEYHTCSVCKKIYSDSKATEEITLESTVITRLGHAIEGNGCTRCDFAYTSGLEYELNDDETAYIVIGIGTATEKEIVIPPTYEGLPVIAIGDEAFEECEFTGIVIPEGVTEIGGFAFVECESLVSVVIPDSVTKIRAGAFGECTALVDVTIGSGVVEIEEDAFAYCEKLEKITISEDNQTYKSVDGVVYSKDGKTLIQYFPARKDTAFTVPAGVERIENFAFRRCKNLVDVTISEGVTEIGRQAFYKCENIENVVLAESIVFIDSGAFGSCEKLESIKLGSNVTEIGYSIFERCTTLKSIVLPAGLSTIAFAAFNSCAALTDIYFCGSEEAWSNINIGPENNYIAQATIHYNYVAE